MNSRQMDRFLTYFLLCAMISGCASHPKPRDAAPPSELNIDKPVPSTTRPDGMDASVDPVDILARRTEQYSRSLEPAIAHRPQASQPTPPAQASGVNWLDPNDLRLSTQPPHDAPPEAQIARATEEHTPTVANQAATLSGGIPAKPVPIAVADPTPPPAPVIPVAPPESVDAMSEKLAKRVREYPHDVSGQLDYQLLQFLLDQQVPNLSAMSALPTEDRELVSAVVDGLSNFRNNLRADSNMLLSRKVKPLLEMSDRLRAQADLTIPTVALCTSVRGFGSYDPWRGDPPEFTAGVEHPVILYCEVQNFSSQLDDNKMWKTELTQEATLYTEGGLAIRKETAPAAADLSRNRRQDFFIVQKIKLPNTLQIGRYLLKVSIEDKQAKRIAQATLPVLIVAQ